VFPFSRLLRRIPLGLKKKGRRDLRGKGKGESRDGAAGRFLLTFGMPLLGGEGKEKKPREEKKERRKGKTSVWPFLDARFLRRVKPREEEGRRCCKEKRRKKKRGNSQSSMPTSLNDRPLPPKKRKRA